MDIAIMYHYVKSKDWKGIVPLEPKDFEKQIDILSKSYEIVSPEDLHKPVGLKPRCVLTFDDGTKDQYTHAYPIMKQKGVPGYFTVMSGPLKQRVVPIFHLVHIVLSFHADEAIWNELRSRYDVSGVEELSSKIYHYEQDIYRRYNKYALNFRLGPNEARDFLYNKAIEVFGSNDQLINQYYMNNDEILEMKSQGMTIGVHCNLHTPYAGDAHAFYQNEVHPCGEYLKHELNITPKWFTPAFGGGENYRDMMIQMEPILKEHGYMGAFTTVAGRNDGLSNFWLKRYDCNSVPPFKEI